MSERFPWIAADPASQRLLAVAEKVAPAPTTLLITGESGSGKDHLARLVHELSPRRDAPFLKIDCTSLPPHLIESELFGHERGAFTGAVERKLLRVLQERTFERLGGTETLRIEARLIALTNTDLQSAVAAGHFREDLFFRLSVLPVVVPPLRDRRADIIPIAEHFVVTLAAIHNRDSVQLSEPARRVVAAYSWPGNLRELRNALERAIIFAKIAELQPEDFPDNIRAAAD